MSDDLRERLMDHIASMELPRAILSDGVIKIVVDDTADALLPFIREEMVTEFERLLGGPRVTASSWATTVLGRVQIRLQQLYDGTPHGHR